MAERSGQRFEIVVLKIHRNNEGSVKELLALEQYLKQKGERYSVLCASYGTPSKALKKTISWYLDKEQLTHPIKTLYEINKMFIDKKVVASGDVSDMDLQSDVEKLVKGIGVLFGIKPKLTEDLEELEEPI